VSGGAVPVALVVAMAENRVIGRGGDMPWTLPSDLKRFRRLTMGKPVVMGRKTFAAIGRPLDGRANIVVTRDPAFAAGGVTRAGGLDEALSIAAALAVDTAAEEVMVIGGGEIYRQALPLAARLYVTRVAAAPEGDTVFPEIDEKVWIETFSEPIPRGERDSADARFVVYERG